MALDMMCQESNEVEFYVTFSDFERVLFCRRGRK